MKEYFSIGEISHLTGLSRHTLRYYDSIHLVTPAIVQENGYRYYSFLQLFTLDWVRHLQQLGFSLDDIRDILNDTTASTLVSLMQRKKAELDDSLARMAVLRDTMEHYLEFFNSLDDWKPYGLPYLSKEPKRYVFSEPYAPGEPLYGTAGYRLMAKKNQPDFEKLYFMRRTGYILDYCALREGRIQPRDYYMFLEKPPKQSFPEIKELPAGKYLCYRCEALSADVDLSALQKALDNLPPDRLVLTNECEYSLDDSLEAYSRSCFELQILL